MRRYVFPIVLGLVGCSILLSLGFWQLRRLEWKEALLASINARLGAEAVDLVSLPAPDPVQDRYRAVRMTGTTTTDEALVVSGQKDAGAGYEVISAFVTDTGRRILLDRGFIVEGDKPKPRPPLALTVSGNLDWPNESDSYTPAPDLKQNVWFARDVSVMAEILKTEPVLVVARTSEGEDPSIVPVPTGTTGIPNDHLNYAITWFSLTTVWAGMTVYLMWRIRRQTV